MLEMDESGESMSEDYQKFMCYQEKVNKRFQELEGMLGLAAQQLEKLKVRRAKGKKIRFDNPMTETKKDIIKRTESEPLHHLKLSFPKYTEGSGVSEWIQDCEQYFTVFQVGEDKKVAIAGMHLQGTARKWFQIYTVGNNSMRWSEFCKKLEARFGIREQELLYDNFKQLQQTSTVNLYFAQFEKYQEQLREKMPSLTEAFFVESFIGGLQSQIKETLKLMAPSTMGQAYRQAIQCEKSEETNKKASKSHALTTSVKGTSQAGKLSAIQKITAIHSMSPEVMKLTPQQLDSKIKEGFCFYCKEKDGINHQCFQPYQFMMQNDESLLEVEVDSEVSITTEEEVAAYDELSGEDKEDWQYEEVICVALGMKDFFEPKQNFEEGNSSGTKLLECTSDFRIKSREMKFDDKEDTEVPTKSGPESQMPQDFIAFTKLANLRLQPTPCFILKVQDVNSSKDYDRELGSSQQHASKGIQVHYKITSADANKGQMQLLIGSGQASETLKAKSDVVLGAQNHHLSDSGTVGKFPREKLEFFCENHLIKCSPCSPRSKFLLEMNSERNTVLVEDGHGLNDSIDVIKEAGARKTEICTNESSMEVVEFASKNLNNEMIPIQLEEVSSIIPTSRDTAEAFHSNRSIKDLPSAEISFDMGIRSSNFGKDKMLIFYPGGQVQLKEVVMKISVGGQLRPREGSSLNFQAMEQLVKGPSHWQRKVVNIEIGNAARLQSQSSPEVSDQFDSIADEINQQYVYSVGIGMVVIPYMCTVLEPGSLENTRRLEDHVVSRKRVLITIFDPGGY